MSISDRELLEFAARAAGFYLEWDGHPDQWQPIHYEGKTYHSWNPLTDDGDALRLAVTLKLEIYFFDGFGEVVAEHNTSSFEPGREQYADDMNAATRRAIVRAAAEIGRTMP